jgi:hyperosmotically inducible protein
MNTRTPFLLLVVGLAVAWAAGCSKAVETPLAPVPAITLGTQVDDTVITSRVRSALVSDELVKSFDLQVVTRKGVVQLGGFVDEQRQIDQAVSVARGVVGVTDVENAMTLKGAPTTLGGKIDDTLVTSRVKAALLADADIKSLDISVVTFNGEVQLTGFVNNQGQIDQAVRTAGAAEGATSVKNELRVKQ